MWRRDRLQEPPGEKMNSFGTIKRQVSPEENHNVDGDKVWTCLYFFLLNIWIFFFFNLSGHISVFLLTIPCVFLSESEKNSTRWLFGKLAYTFLCLLKEEFTQKYRSVFLSVILFIPLDSFDVSCLIFGEIGCRYVCLLSIRFELNNNYLTAVSLSRNKDPGNEDNPQSLLWAI